jgi:hypothetical protein
MTDASKYHDARIIADYNPDEPHYLTPTAITLGKNKNADEWEPSKAIPHVKALFDILSRHPEKPSKDGLAFVSGEMVPGPRAKTAATAMYALTFDFDRGTDPQVIDAGFLKLGCAFLRYSSFTNGKTRSDFSRDAVCKFLKCSKNSLDTEAMRRYVREKEKWVEEVAATVELIEVKQVSGGFKCFLSHAPLHKNRVIVPLATPFVIDDYENLQEATAKWNALYFGVAGSIGLLDHIDRTGADLNRLFYFPRHPKGGAHDTVIAGGRLLDLSALDFSNPWAAESEAIDGGGKTSQSKTPEGRDLGKWWITFGHRCQLADLLEGETDKVRPTQASAGVTIECPFDEEHSNPGEADDAGCFAVNAGDGNGHGAFVKCQHNSCCDYKTPYYVAKMLKDDWFTRKTLESDNYNSLPDDATPATGNADTMSTTDSKDAPASDNAKPESKSAEPNWQEAIDKLTPESSDEDVEEVICMCLDAGLAIRAMEGALADIADKSGTHLTVIRKVHKICAKDMRSDRDDNKTNENHGLEIFYHKGEFGFDDAVKACVRVLKQANEKAQLPQFCQINGNPVRLDLRDGRAEFVSMTHAALWSELNRRLAFVEQYDKGVSARRKVPEDVARHVHEQSYVTLPPAPEVVHVPIYLKSGDLLLGGRYHYAPDDKEAPRNHLLLPNGLVVPPVPKEPTLDDVMEARDWLLREYLGDFPFFDLDENGVEQREPSQANALALLLTPFMRPMIEGRTPLFAIVKPQTGSGATFLAQLAINLLEGFEDARAPLNYTVREDEMEKTLVSAIKETRSTLFFDDVKDFNNRLLLRSLTAARVGGRILGQSRLFERPNTLNWIVTGVNPRIGGEMWRRTCWIRLNPKTPDGEERTFTHAESFYAEHRGLAIRHILTLIEYWLEQGAPEFTDRNLSGFDDWCKKVGGVLAACEVEGFVQNKAKLVLDTESVTENEFLQDLKAKLNGDKRDLSDLFKWATDSESAFVVGRTPDERQRNFMDRVIGMDGKTFKVTKNDVTTKHMLRIEQTDTEIKVGVVLVPEVTA